MLPRGPMIAAPLAVLMLTTQVNAAESGNEFLGKLVGRLYHHGESFACFSRQYSAEHLAAHPSQRVTFIKVLIDAYFRKEPIPNGKGAYSYQVSLAFAFRDRTDILTGVAECGDGTPRDSIRGGAHCAGPGTDSHLALSGKQLLVMTIPSGADLWLPGPKDQRHETVKNPFGADDRVFRMIRTDLKQCEDLAFDRQKPLRPYEP